MRRFLAILLVVFVFPSCEALDEGEVLEVNILQLLKDKPSFFDFFEKVEIIPLDDSCLTSNGQYSEPQYFAVSDDGLFVLDERNFNVYSYDSAGRFRSVISRLGRAENEYSLAYGIRIDDQSGTLTVLDPRGNFFHYSQQGEFIEKERIGNEVAVHNFWKAEEGTLLFSSTDEKPLKKWDGTKVVDIPFSPAIPLKGTFNAPDPFMENEKGIYYYDGMSGSIYAIDMPSARIVPVWRWNFGAATADLSQIVRPEYDFMKSLEGSFYGSVFPFLNMMLWDNLLIADVLYNNREHSLFYDLYAKRAFFFDRFKEGIRFKAVAERDGVLYMLIEPEVLDEFVNAAVLDDENTSLLHAIQGKQTNAIILKYTGLSSPGRSGY